MVKQPDSWQVRGLEAQRVRSNEGWLCCYSRQEPAFSILFLVPSTLLDCLVLGGAILKHLAVGIDNYVNKCLEVARR